jgi:hypothetical protein
MTTHTTTTGDRDTRETPWPIDHEGQKVLIEATVYDEGDEENPDHRYYTVDIATGAPRVRGHRLVGIREDHVRRTVRRIPEPPAEPTMVAASMLKGFEVNVFGDWHVVLDVVAGKADAHIHLVGGTTIAVDRAAVVPARLPEVA